MRKRLFDWQRLLSQKRSKSPFCLLSATLANVDLAAARASRLVAVGGGEGLARGEAGAAGGVLAGAAGGDAGDEAMEVATDDPLMLLS